MYQTDSSKQSARQRGLLGKWQKMHIRLQKLKHRGRFLRLSRFKRQQILARLRRYALQLQRLGYPLRNVLKGSALALALALVSPNNSIAQQIIFEQDDLNNPFGTFDVGRFSTPVFVDIDNDGDFDAFSGEYDGDINFFENTGSSTAPEFTERVGMDNPFGAFDPDVLSTPTFVDIDNDGDFDAFTGAFSAKFSFFENTGSNTTPEFIERVDMDNPLGALTVDNATPAFVDIDMDGDFDMFCGHQFGKFRFFENTGSNTTPEFTEKTGMDNPLGAFDLSNDSNPAFVDIDMDGDFDAFAGAFSGKFAFFENTGSNTAPEFTEKTDMDNPLGTFDLGTRSAPAFVDIDMDGDFDMLSGDYYGKFFYFENKTITVSLEDQQSEAFDLALFPNPTNAYISWEGPVLDRVELRDVYGRLLHEKEGPSNKLDLSKWGPGVYYLRCWMGDQFVLRSVVKK